MRLDAIGIVSADLNKSITFYRLLGLNFPDLNEGENHVEATTPGGIRVMLDSESLIKKLKPNWTQPVGQRTTLAFLCETPAKVDELYENIVKAGFRGEKEPWDAFWGQRYASVLDPDGNSVDIFAQLDSEAK